LLLEFTRQLVALRREHPNFHRRKFFQDREIGLGSEGHAVDGHREQDIVWVRPDGREMAADEWHAGWVRCIGLALNGKTLDDVNSFGEPIKDDSFLLLYNPHDGPVEFYMPKLHGKAGWQLCLDTSKPTLAKKRVVRVAQPYELTARAVALFRELEG
jgi:glycogen operon protein